MKFNYRLIAVTLLLFAQLYQSFGQQADQRRKKEIPLEIPADKLKLVIGSLSENTFASATSFQWEIDGINNNDEAGILAAKLMAADANMKSVSIKYSSGSLYHLRFQIKEPFKDRGFLKIFNSCGIEYVSMNGRNLKIADYINK